MLARTVCNQKLVIFRRTDGSVAALEDACWHRLLPLSMGTLDGDEVTCGYHGLVFNAEGRCTHMPSQETLNPSACVRSYPVVERHRFIWVWPGDASLADPALIPDLHWNDDPAWAGDGKLITVKCDYRLVVDNLMDLTHETFVHGSQHRPPGGGRGAVRRHPWRPHGDGDPLDEGHRGAAVLGRPDPRTPMATPARSTAGRSSASRRRRRSRSTSASHPPAAARYRATTARTAIAPPA